VIGHLYVFHPNQAATGATESTSLFNREGRRNL
jgi:hypothetical protein